jgi:oxygen-dependent protoporphyrinogen oxidase
VRLVVVGAGIAGLAAAWEARRLADAGGLALDISVLESEARAGGKLWTERENGVALEWGPDSFVASKPATRDLAEQLGLELVRPLSTARRAYLLIGGELRPFPPGLVMGIPRGTGGIVRAVRSGIVGPRSAARALMEPFVPGRIKDRPVSRVLRRHLGSGWSERMVEPLLEGVYGAPADQLGMRSALPQFAGGRSLILAARRLPAPLDPSFLSIRGGMGRLAERLVEELAPEDVRLRTSALALSRRDGAFAVAVPDDEIEADTIVLAVPAPVASGVLRPLAPDAARRLAEIRFSSSAVALLRYSKGSIGRSLDGSGYLVPSSEGLAHAACSWVTSKWPNEAEDIWLRAIVTSPAHLRDDDEMLGARIAREIGSVMRATADPTEIRIRWWDRALPIYGPGHLENVEAVERELPAGVAVAGASFRGLGVPDCIESGRAAARRLVEGLAGRGRGPAPPRG